MNWGNYITWKMKNKKNKKKQWKVPRKKFQRNLNGMK